MRGLGFKGLGAMEFGFRGLGFGVLSDFHADMKRENTIVHTTVTLRSV